MGFGPHLRVRWRGWVDHYGFWSWQVVAKPEYENRLPVSTRMCRDRPTNHVYVEAFNSRFRLECLNRHWFLAIEEARYKVEACRRTTTKSNSTARWRMLPQQCSPSRFLGKAR